MTRCATQLIMKSSPKGSPWRAQASIPEQQQRQQQQQHQRGSRWTGTSKSGVTATNPGLKTASSPEELTKVDPVPIVFVVSVE